MLYNFLLAILVIDAIVLTVAILLQSGKGGGLAASFGGASSSPDAFVGIRQAGTILTKATWYCGGVFLFLAFLLQVMSTRSSAPRSVLEEQFRTPAPASAPSTIPGVTAPVAPAIPLEPATGGAAGGAPKAGAPAPASPQTSPVTPPAAPPATKR